METGPDFYNTLGENSLKLKGRLLIYTASDPPSFLWESRRLILMKDFETISLISSF